jgi:PAS domain S-box-containing protein
VRPFLHDEAGWDRHGAGDQPFESRHTVGGTTAFLNQRWLDYTGLSMEEALGWGWQAAIHAEDLEKLMATWLGLLASGEPGQEEARLRRFDGEYRWFLFRAVPVRNEGGKVVRWYGTNTDIEDLKRVESLLSAEKRTLEMIADGASLTDILDNLCRTIDAQAPNTITTVLLMDPDGKRLWPAAGPRVPGGWNQAITPLEIGPCVGSCGTAAFLEDAGDRFGHRQRSLIRQLSGWDVSRYRVEPWTARFLVSAAYFKESGSARYLCNVLCGTANPER